MAERVHPVPLARRGSRVAVILVVCGLLASACRWSSSDDVTPGAVEARQKINAMLDDADEAEQQGDTALADAFRAQAEQAECDWFQCRPALGTTSVAMDPTRADGFFSMPWPSDTRRKADGSLDLGGFPGRDTIALADTTLARGEVATFGFGRNSASFFQATGPLAPATLPTPDASTHRRSTAVLIDLDHPGSAPAPLLVDFKAPAAALRPANLLTVLPYPGHPLKNDTRYAAVLFDGVNDAAGQRLAPSPLISQLDGSVPSGTDAQTWTKLRQDRDDTRQAIRSDTLWHPSQMVAFSVFTTQDTGSDMAAITRAVNAAPTPSLVRSVQSPQVCSPTGVARFNGTLDLPSWQEGTTPFLTSGGGIVVGPDGNAVQQGTDPVQVDMAVPCAAAPPGGWPILLSMGGTGGSANAQRISQLGHDTSDTTTILPYVVVSIAPLFSGDREVPSPLPPALEFFNYLNPVAGRTNQLQQAADMLWLKRAAQQLTFGPQEAGGAGHNGIDDDTVVVVGHSQGALTLPITLAADPTITGAFISSGGAGFYHALVHRGEIRDLLDGILSVQPGEFDIFHPYAQVLQTLAETGDATNYGGEVFTPDIVIYGGLQDGCSIIEATMHLTQTLGLPVAHPVTRRPLFGSTALEPPVVPLPVSENLAGGRTGVLVQTDHDHFGASALPMIGRSFVDSISAGGPTIEDPGSLDAPPNGVCGHRFDPPPAAD